MEEIEILSEKGINTMFLPAMEISEVSLGPLVEMGSLAICTRMYCPCLRISLIFPCLLISERRLNLLMGMGLPFLAMTCPRYLFSELNCGPKSR